MASRVEELRAEVAAFVATHRPEGLEAAEAHPPHDREQTPAEVAWTRALREGGWLGVSWPAAYGGRSLSPLECAAVKRRIPHDAILSHVSLADFELRLHQGDDLVGLPEEPHHRR